MRTLYVSDLDGTLLNSQSQVSAASAEMLNKATASGTLFTVATARTPATVIPLLARVEMPLPVVVMTGCAFFNFKASKLVSPRFMDPAIAASLVEDWRKSGLSGFVYTLDHQGVLQVYHIGPLSDLERGFIAERCDTPCKVFNVPESGESFMPEDLSRTMLLFGMQPSMPAKEFFDRVSARYGEKIVPQYYHDIFGDRVAMVEMFPQGVNKATALERLASDVGADRLVVFGDNVNDIPMMRLADEAVAVRNAQPEVIEVATAVIGTNDTDAVARFILNERIKS